MSLKYILVNTIFGILLYWVNLDYSFDFMVAGAIGGIYILIIVFLIVGVIKGAITKNKKLVINCIVVAVILFITITATKYTDKHKADLTISKVELLIDKIERYKEVNGKYPDHLTELSGFDEKELETHMGIFTKHTLRYNSDGESYGFSFDAHSWMIYNYDSLRGSWTYDD